MTRKSLPTFDAEFRDDDGRFAICEGETYAVLLQDCSDRNDYSEKLGEFDGYREEFVELAEKHELAVLASRERSDGNYDMIGLYRIYAIQSYGEPFECRVGMRVAKLKEL